LLYPFYFRGGKMMPEDDSWDNDGYGEFEDDDDNEEE
jgi:hypothetical protein